MSFLGYGKEKHGNYGGFGSNTIVTGLDDEILETASRTKEKKKTRKNSGYLYTTGKGTLYNRQSITSGKGTLYNRLFTKRNRAKRLSFNASNNNGIQNNGYVEGQTENNNTEGITHDVAEQNFLTRILKMTKNAIIKDSGEPLDLQAYKYRLEEGAILSKRLVSEYEKNGKKVKQKTGRKIIRTQGLTREESLTREEAILVYDELMALFIMYVVYITLLMEYSNKHPHEMGKLERPDNLKSWFSKLFEKPTGIIDKFYNAAWTTVELTGSIGTAGLFAVPLYYIRRGDLALTAREGLTGESDEGKASLVDTLGAIYQVMFSKRNIIPIHDVMHDLKYWGLDVIQVGFLFEISPQIAYESSRKGPKYEALRRSTNEKIQLNLRILNRARENLKKGLQTAGNAEHIETVTELMNTNKNMLYYLLFFNLPESEIKAPNEPLPSSVRDIEERDRQREESGENSNEGSQVGNEVGEENASPRATARAPTAAASLKATATATPRATALVINSSKTESEQDEDNKKQLISINDYIVNLRKTLKNRTPPQGSLRNYMRKTLKIDVRAKPLYDIFEVLTAGGKAKLKGLPTAAAAGV
jgi:hypothetical protein